MEVKDTNVDNTLLHPKSYENTLVYNTLYKIFIDAKPLHIRLDKVDRIIKIHDEIRYLELSNSYNEVYYRINSTIYDAIFDNTNYLISEKIDDKYN